MKAALPIFLAILGNLLYHSSQKLTSHQVNPFLSIAVSFSLAAVLSFGIFLATKSAPISAEAGRLNWAAIGLGVAVVVIETSFLLGYRMGWQVGVTSLIVTVGQTILLIPLGLLVFGERITTQGLVGAAIGLVGLVLVSMQAAPR